MSEVYGIVISPVPEGWTALEALVICQAIDENGKSCWFTRFSDGMGSMAVVGALHLALASETKVVLDELEDDDD